MEACKGPRVKQTRWRTGVDGQRGPGDTSNTEKAEVQGRKAKMKPEAAEGDRNRGESTQRKTERIREKNKWKEEKVEYRTGKKDRAGWEQTRARS